MGGVVLDRRLGGVGPRAPDQTHVRLFDREPAGRLRRPALRGRAHARPPQASHDRMAEIVDVRVLEREPEQLVQGER